MFSPNNRHAAIIDYFVENGFADSIAAFQKEGEVDPPASASGLMEKKWTSILRLQKKVCKQAQQSNVCHC
jgi:platelet-activating factor acetylhydrolase IB subunit alpha